MTDDEGEVHDDAEACDEVEGIWISSPNAQDVREADPSTEQLLGDESIELHQRAIGEPMSYSSRCEFIAPFEWVGDQHERVLVIDFLRARHDLYGQMDCLGAYCYPSQIAKVMPYVKRIRRLEALMLKRVKALIGHWSNVRRRECIRVIGPKIGLGEEIRRARALPEGSPLSELIAALNENADFLFTLCDVWSVSAEHYRRDNHDELWRGSKEPGAREADRALQTCYDVVAEFEEAITAIRDVVGRLDAMGPRIEVVTEKTVRTTRRSRRQLPGDAQRGDAA